MKQIKQEDISLESSLLKALANKNNYDRYIKCLDVKRLIPITANLLKDYKKYYDKYKEDIDFNTFYPIFVDWHKKDLDEQDLAYYRDTVFSLIRDSRIENSLFVNLLEREATAKIEEAISKGVDEEAINKIMSELHQQKQTYLGGKDDDSIFSLGEIDLTALDTSNGLTWFLPSLQANLNSHMPGQFIVVAADSDTGKSAFCISQVVHVFQELNRTGSKRPILYCTSEDTKEDLTCRFLSCLYKDKCLGGFEEIITQHERVGKSYAQNYDDSLFIGMAIRGASDLGRIKTKILDVHPSLIVIDMLDKLSSSDNIQDLTRLYQDIRGIANDGYQIIGTSQTGNTSYQDSETKEYKHRRWLTDKDLANSKSGKQGAAYCMIMIGKDDDVPGVRYLSTTKKKRGSHCNVICQLDDKYSLYRELL